MRSKAYEKLFSMYTFQVISNILKDRKVFPVYPFFEAFGISSVETSLWKTGRRVEKDWFVLADICESLGSCFGSNNLIDVLIELDTGDVTSFKLKADKDVLFQVHNVLKAQRLKKAVKKKAKKLAMKGQPADIPEESEEN